MRFCAIYDLRDNYISSGFTAKELGLLPSTLSKMIKRQNEHKHLKYRVYIIPLAPQDDCFKKEDELFLSEVPMTNREKAKQLGISETTFYERKRYEKHNI